ncbi:hypothetical protein Salat_1450100 [Sesamum alatum]|uniref:Uncharacterized protein n=1 Tax=Sesamum alatum TaxID=300844 RepID=A0AAE2CLY6_9LAMI|nr:hypothetical protein Salat_1450100 [Sesamum alatum]
MCHRKYFILNSCFHLVQYPSDLPTLHSSLRELEKSTNVAENVSEVYSEKSRTENISRTYLERANAGENVSMACLESVALETKRKSVVENVYEADSEGVAPETKRAKLP